jgi:hypothetical protein
MKTNASNSRARSPLFALLAHYVTGGIDEPIWERFMGIMDADSIGTADRLAYARLLHAVLVDPQGPSPDGLNREAMAGLLQAMRVPRAA